ncbi:MAG: 30S ribosomal protein THX [Bacteroidales bacterium]|nr:30S ribosomal protein THX [Bacteroidales bacterium]
MGKGDKKTKRGKIVIGSAGVSRQKKKNPHIHPIPKKAVDEVAPETAKKPAAKKVAAKKESPAKE